MANVTDTIPRVEITATAGQTVLTYNFLITDEGDIKVYQNDTLLTLTTHYTVTGVNNESGGTVVLVTGATLDDSIVLLRDTAITRDSTYTTGGVFRALTIEAEQTEEYLIMQELETKIARSLTPSDSSTANWSNISLPDPDANKLIAWNGSGDNLVNTVAVVASNVVATGSTEARELADRFADNANVLDFGAVGDNATDDLAAFNLALAYNSTILIPSGTYRLSSLPNFEGHFIIGLNVTLVIDDIRELRTSKLDIEHVIGMTIRGKNDTKTELTGITAVSGSAANWSVTATLDDVTNFEVGDAVAVDVVRPGSGDPRLFSGRPIAGQMDDVNAKCGTLSATGTALTVSGGSAGEDFNANASVGDLIIAVAQVKTLTAVTPTSGTISSAFVDDFAGHNSYFTLRPEAGTVTVSGTAVTGTGTSFTTKCNVGDLLPIADCGIGIIESIASNTSLTLKEAVPTVTSKNYGVVVLGEKHEGIWKITAISGNDVTWTNTAQRTIDKPPINQVASGDVRLIKTVFTSDTGVSGVSLGEGSLDLSNIAFFGDGTSASTIGIDTRGRNPSLIRISGVDVGDGYRTGVSGFGYNCRLDFGSTVIAERAFLANSVTMNVENADGGRFYGKNSISGGNKGVSVKTSYDAFSELNGALVHSCSTTSIRSENGGELVAEYLRIIGSGGENFLNFGNGQSHLVGCRMLDSDDVNFQLSNGGFARVSGSLMVGGSNGNLNIAFANVEANNSHFMSSGGANCIINDSNFKTSITGSSGSVTSYGLRGTGSSNIGLEGFQSTLNAIGIYVEDGAVAKGDAMVSSGNFTTDYQCAADGSYSVINFTNGVGSPTYSPSVNVYNVNGDGFISDGTNDISFSKLKTEEKGTFTASFSGVAVTYTSRVANYTVIDDMVYWDAYFDISSFDNADTSVGVITGLPFTALQNGVGQCNINYFGSSLLNVTAGSNLFLAMQTGATSLRFVDEAGGNETYDGGKFNASGDLYLSGFYRKA